MCFLMVSSRPGLNRRMLLLCLGVIAAAAPLRMEGAESPEGIVAVRDAFADSDLDGSPDRLGAVLRVRGVLLADPVPLFGGASLVNLQDPSGGVVLFTRKGELLRGRVQRGDFVEATGEVAIFRGNRQLMVKDVGRIEAGESPPPKELRVIDLRDYAGELVQVAGRLDVARDFLTRREPVLLHDESGAMQVVVGDHLFTNPEFLDRFSQGGWLTLVGIPVFAESAGSPVLRLIPRDADDFRFEPVPPYREIAIAIGFAILLVWGSVAVYRRRRSDQRARQLSDEAQRAAEERDRFFTLSIDLLCIANIDGRFRRLNPAFSQTLGWSMEELLARPIVDLVHPADRPATIAALAKLAAGESVFNFENRYRCKGGDWKVLSWRSVAQPDGTVFATARDVTAQTAAQEALRLLNCDLERRVSERTAEVRQALATLDVTDDGAFIFDPESLRFTYVNEGAVRLLGYAREVLLGMSPGDIEVDHDARGFRGLLASMMRGEVRSRQITTHYRRSDGRAIGVEVNLQYVAPAGEAPRFIAMARDVTERRNAESLSRRSQRMEALGALASGVAHDLNNALTPVLMSISLLRARFPEDAQMIETLRASAQRGAQMVRQLLTFAKGAEGNHTASAPDRLLREIEQIARFTFPKNIRVELRCAEDVPCVRGDTTQLHQVLLNLCVNARDAMPDGGTLTIEARMVEIDQLAGAVPEAKPGTYVVFRVSDTGMGIRPEVMERIFDPFFTTKTADQGTGLGLSTVVGIMKGHGGFIHVYSQAGLGSSFSAYLPVATVPDAAGRKPDSSAHFRGNHELILLVDDESAVRETGLHVLKRMQLNPIAAVDGVDGLRCVAERGTSLRAIVTDLHMPRMDGLAMVRAIRCTLPQLPVIVTSGRMEEREQDECRLLGVRAFLAKPFTEEQLASVMTAVLTPAGNGRCGPPAEPPRNSALELG